ncbi:hypothetical protein HHK36_012810 [Tetracentron sinense]|uniref:CDT1 Geminin-binding domain-containing protein n=1 Tax=Tetracentron sinense TaxID=13715 RepID=A0A835DFV4_TETSI|nr:hypothetical protein HHK36_012810 [Tetracentron sinense]
MEPSSASPFNPFKSKKIIRSSSKSASSDETLASDQNPLSSKTPEKPMQLPRRTRNRGVSISLQEVKKIEEGLQKSKEGQSDRTYVIRSRTDSCSSARNQIGSGSSVNPDSTSSKAQGSIKLPEKYEILGEFFSSMDSSIRLLRLKRSMSTFTNICPKIESLTDRRFSYGHLAQLKFILPEVIIIKKVLLHDERTLCMKPDLQVSLQVDALQNEVKGKTGSAYFSLRKVFRARLLEFFKAHPEGDEIPEDTLPEPFNQTRKHLFSNTIKVSNSSLPVQTSDDSLPAQHPAVASHLSRSFQRHFSLKVSNHEALNSHLKPSNVHLQLPVSPVSEPCLNQISSNEETLPYVAPSPIKCCSKPPTSKKSLTFGASPVKLIPSSTLETLGEETECMKNENCSPIDIADIQVTPSKLTSTPAKLMTITPTLQPPKRCHMSPDDDFTNSPNKLVRRLHRTRSLKFDTPVKISKAKDEINEIGGSSVDTDIYDILPETLLQSIREKERKVIEEQDPAISQAKRRQQMITCLPKLFDTIHLLFQSIKHSLLTEEELIHKIIASHCDIVDRREVEEQLTLLQELVPEWISGKVASSGDFLLRINKMLSAEHIRVRLAEAE